MPPETAPTRVLVVEDSLVMRELLVSILQDAAGLQVVGTAGNGAEAVRLAKQLEPDIITMDVYMPEMDGYEATRQIMAEVPSPIVMITSDVAQNEQKVSFNALQAGALSIINKPTMVDPPEVYQSLVSQIKLMAEVKVVRRWSEPSARAAERRPIVGQTPLARGRKLRLQLVALASSTGGPGALAAILGQLPADFPVPVLIVQHITPGFGAGLASWLNQQTPLEVRVAQLGDRPQASQVLIAPDDYHMTVNSQGLIALRQAELDDHLCPSADRLFYSLAQVFGPTAVGIILTGMGRDGAEGLWAMRTKGAPTIAQDEASCVVFGMPAVAIDLGAVEQVQPLAHIPEAILRLLNS